MTDVALPPPAVDTADVLAVVVGHNGARWAPELVAGLAAQRRRPDRVVVVDTGSRDDTGDALATGIPSATRLVVDRRSGFGAAVQAGVDTDADTGRGQGPAADATAPTATADEAPHHSWLWLLHDDCAPEPGALAALLAAAQADPEVGVVGPKVLGWDDRRRLLEVGLTISRSGRRETGLEPEERDQGQHDDVQRVLAVGTAGMLVRRDVWERLGGFDPHLALFRDDVDLGWRANLAGVKVVVAPGAVVHHVQAASAGRRTIDAGTRRRHLFDRRSAMYVLLVDLPARSLWLAYPRLVLTTLFRVVGFALGKLPGLALDEAAALGSAVLRVDRVWRARRARAPLRQADAGEVLRLLAPRGTQVARALDSVAGVFSRDQPGADLAARGHRAVETGPVDDDLEDVEPIGLQVLRRVLSPGVVLTAALVVITAVACRDLVGSGRLMGGALLPAPDSARDLWRTYSATWHDVGLGSDAVAPPYLAVVAALGTLLLGKAPLAVEVLMIGAVPLAGLTALLAARRLLDNRWVQVWAAGTYALVPATTGAVAGGRLGTAVATVVLPLVALGVARVVGSPGRAGSWSSAWASALALAALAAFVPLGYPVVVLLLLLAVAGASPSRAVLARLAVVVLTPPVLLLPWTIAVVERPGLLLLEAGLPGPGLSDPALAPVSLLLQSSGGPGALPWWLGFPLVAGALAALLSDRRRRLVLAGWATAGTGLAVGLAVSLTTVSTATAQTAVAAWPGFGVAVVAGGLLLASAVGAERARTRLGQRSFGWRQPLTLVVVGVAALAPVVLAGWWVVRGADDPLARRDPVVLPPFVAAEGDEPARPRTVVLARGDDGSIRYGLLRDTGPRLGDAETGPPYASFDRLDVAVADLVSGRGGQEAEVLTDHAVRYVLVAAPVDEDLVATIDAVPGLRRLSTNDGAALWSLPDSAARLRLLDADGAVLAPLAAGLEGARTQVPAGAEGRTAVLAELADDRWRATVDGVALAGVVVDGWAQGWAVPAEGGELVVIFDGSVRDRWLALQGALVVLVVILALPGARRPEALP